MNHHTLYILIFLLFEPWATIYGQTNSLAPHVHVFGTNIMDLNDYGFVFEDFKQFCHHPLAIEQNRSFIMEMNISKRTFKRISKISNRLQESTKCLIGEAERRFPYRVYYEFQHGDDTLVLALSSANYQLIAINGNVYDRCPVLFKQLVKLVPSKYSRGLQYLKSEYHCCAL